MSKDPPASRPWDRLRRGARRHPHVTDTGVAVGLCAFTLVTTGLRGQLNAGAVLAAAAGFGALAARRCWPLTVLAVT